MWIGPFLKRELITSARRRQLFQDRFTATGLVAAAVGACVVIAVRNEIDPASVFGVRFLAQTTFGVLVALLTGGVIAHTPVVLGAVIARERDRKSLDSLLSTRFSSAEIVLGTAAAGLFKAASSHAALLPLLVLVVWLGGIDPHWLVLVMAGLASTGLALAALAVAVSAGARTAQRAVSCALFLALGWMCLPPVLVVLLPRVWPAAAGWLAPLLLWGVDSSPLGLAFNVVGVISRGPLVDALWRMIALQLAAARSFLAWAIVRLRPASRAVDDVVGRSMLLRSLRTRHRDRPACGDDPVLWNEMHSTRGTTRAERIASGFLHFVWVGLVGVVMLSYAAPAFLELCERGYSWAREAQKLPEFYPLARAIAARSMNTTAPAAPGQARLEFNIMLRHASGVLALFYVLIIAGSAAESVAVERECDTWPGLIATPLGAVEILRAKMLGAFWRVRGIVWVLIVLWTVGLLSGALHPLGFLAAPAVLFLSGALGAAWGVHASLWAPDRQQAVGRILPFVLFISASGLIALGLPLWRAKLVAAGGSAPFLVWASLLSYEDVHALLHSGSFLQLGPIGITEPALVVMAVCLIGASAHGLGALCFTKAALGGFAEAAGRPRRAAGNPAP
jgi:hypothetical protein